MNPRKIPAGVWARLKRNCPLCRRDIRTNNAGVLNPHYNQRTGVECPGGGRSPVDAATIAEKVGSNPPQPAVALVEKLPEPWEEK